MSTYVPASAADAYEAENTFYLRCPPARLGKLLAHYELYKQIAGLPGAVIEMGVYKGASLTRFATYRSLLENADSRPLFGFDAFGAFPREDVAGEADRAFIDRFENAGGEGIARADLEAILAEKGLSNVNLIEGNIFDTLPVLLDEKPELRVALLHLDLDVYEPTLFALERLLPRMVKGGLILFDDYGMVEGATRAADEIAQAQGLTIGKLSHYAVPAFYRIA
jgi:hypothetical protein